MPRVAEENRNEEEDDIEGYVDGVQGLEDPVARVTDLRAEDSEDEEEDGDFGKANTGPVEDVMVIRELVVLSDRIISASFRMIPTWRCVIISCFVTFH